MIRISERDLKGLQARGRSGAGKPGTPSAPTRGGRLPRAEADPPPDLAFSAPIPPQPKQRARTFVDTKAIIAAFVQARGDVRRFASLIEGILMRSVTPEATRSFEAAVRQVAMAAMARRGGDPFSCAVALHLAFVIEGDPGTWPTSQGDGDLDNHAKAVKDALNKVAYVDDRLVVDVTMSKRCGPEARVEVRVRAAPVD